MINPANSNLFANLPPSLTEELCETLVESPSVRVERIVSYGQCSPEGFWYDQDEAEFIILLQGAASLLIEGETKAREMKPGDCLNIPPHQKHRVEWTDPNRQTIWVVTYYT